MGLWGANRRCWNVDNMSRTLLMLAIPTPDHVGGGGGGGGVVCSDPP